jgi:hypothetical protein
MMTSSQVSTNPDINLALKLLAPRAAAVKQWSEERAQLKEERLLAFGVAAEAASSISLESLLSRCRESDEHSDFAEAVLRMAVAEASRRKTAALGRLLALGLQEGDAEIDEAWLMLNAVADLEQPHLRVLRRLHDEGDRYHGVLDTELARTFPNGVALMYPLLKTLERHGLAGPLSGPIESTPDTPVEWAIWDFGVLVLERLFLCKPATDGSRRCL